MYEYRIICMSIVLIIKFELIKYIKHLNKKQNTLSNKINARLITCFTQIAIEDIVFIIAKPINKAREIPEENVIVTDQIKNNNIVELITEQIAIDEQYESKRGIKE